MHHQPRWLLLALCLAVAACQRPATGPAATPTAAPAPTLTPTPAALPVAAPTATPATLPVSAPSPSETWLRAYGGGLELAGTSIVPLAGGGYLVAAPVEAEAHDTLQFALFWLDPAGGVLQARTYASDCRRASQGAGSYDRGESGMRYYWASLAATDDGGGALAMGARLVRLDAEGSPLWSRQYLVGGRYPHELVVASLVALDDGGFILCGSHALPPQDAAGGHEDPLILLRVDRQGDVTWAQEYPTLFGSKHPQVLLAPSGELLLGSRATAGGSRYKVAVSQIDPATGGVNWARTVTAAEMPSRPHHNDPEVGDTMWVRFQALGLTANGSLILCQGYRLCGGQGVLVTRLTPSGGHVWSTRIHSPSHNGETMVRAVLAAGNDALLVGAGTEFQQPVRSVQNLNALVMRLSGDGNVQLIRSLGRSQGSIAHCDSDHSNDDAAAGVLLDDGGLLLVGGSDSFNVPDPCDGEYHAQQSDLLLARLSAEGDIAGAGEYLHVADVGDQSEVDITRPQVAVADLVVQAQPVELTVEPCTYATTGAGDALQPREIEAEGGPLDLVLHGDGRRLTSKRSIFVDPDEDIDGDGLDQEWENAALELTNPYLELDEDEVWLDEQDQYPMAIFSRVTPYPSREDPRYVLFYSCIGWHLDYGGGVGYNPVVRIESHRGDTERFIMAWKVISPRSLRLDWVFTSSHKPGTDHSGVWHADDRTCTWGEIGNLEGNKVDSELMCASLNSASDGRLVLQASEDKHALYPTIRVCEEVNLIQDSGVNVWGENCGGGGHFLFPTYNAGEPDRPHQLIDDLERPETWRGLTQAQVQALSGLYPGEAIWSGNEHKRAVWNGDTLVLEGCDFCGGIREGLLATLKCSGFVGAKLGAVDEKSERAPVPPILVEKLESRYRITIETGRVDKAGTDAHINIQLLANGGALGVHNLVGSFERGDVDVIHAGPLDYDVGELEAVEIWHDNAGEGPGWYLEEVRVFDKVNGREWVFPARRWLATDEGDGQIRVTLQLAP